MRHIWLRYIALGALVANPLRAQDSTPPAPALRHRIEERFASRIQEQLGLDSNQMKRLRATSFKFGGRRRELETRQMAVHRALGLQLRPGTAADKDSVAKLTDALVAGRVAYAKTYQEELAELRTYLDPVQRAQLMAMRERLVRRAREFRNGRGEGEGGFGRRGKSFMDR